MSITSVTARDQVFKIQQVAGNLFVCAADNGGCCCGHVAKGRASVNKALYESQWQDRGLRPSVHLTFVGCLGPCPVGNNAMLQIFGRSIWFKDLNDDALIPLIFDYIAQALQAGVADDPTGVLAGHVYDRYTLPSIAAGPTDFTGLDPVCMMSVDENTAQWRSDLDGVSYGFCSPGCKRAFDKNPAVYLNPSEPQPSAMAVQVLAKQGDFMTKTFVVPNISCDHCVRSIKNELAELKGVAAVQADAQSKVVTVEWADPADWEQIKAALAEIDYAPQELIQL